MTKYRLIINIIFNISIDNYNRLIIKNKKNYIYMQKLLYLPLCF